MPEKPDYGVDAPGIVFSFLAGGPVLIAFGIFLAWNWQTTLWLNVAATVMIAGVIGICEGLLMLLYAKKGKFRHRARMLNMHTWRGDEQVLDVGTGRGLLLIGAAKRLTTGRGTGIDIWSTKDLSGNAMEATERNFQLEGVQGRVALKSEDARRLDFPDSSFDVVLSNLCIHNIPGSEGRTQACREIVRVLKPGGLALISDFIRTSDYKKVFKEAGLEVSSSTNHLAFPPLTIVKARKPVS